MQTLVPLFFSEAGSCLTPQNWKDAGVTTISCSLQALLFKPGLDILFNIKDFKSWLGWDGSIVINAQMPGLKTEGLYQLKSPWDGSILKITPTTIMQLIQHLHPDWVILPYEIQQKDIPISPFQETDQPAIDGFEGKIYTQSGIQDLKDRIFSEVFEPLDKTCSCQICSQQFTKAYLHHLYLNTPLLAQRYLIMHNISWRIAGKMHQ